MWKQYAFFEESATEKAGLHALRGRLTPRCVERRVALRGALRFRVAQKTKNSVEVTWSTSEH